MSERDALINRGANFARLHLHQSSDRQRTGITWDGVDEGRGRLLGLEPIARVHGDTNAIGTAMIGLVRYGDAPLSHPERSILPAPPHVRVGRGVLQSVDPETAPNYRDATLPAEGAKVAHF